MKVEKKTIDALNLELSIKLVAEDYAPSQKKILNNYKRKADFKGFRKGMVPTSLIEKVYGEQILAESVNEVVSEALNSYIKDNNLHILGEPLGSEKQPELEWKSGNDFTFLFDIALSPEINLEIEAKDEIPSYSVTVSAKDKEPMIESMKKYYEEKKEEKSEEEIEKEVTERLKAQYKNEAEWRVNKDIRDYFVKKAAVVIPEDFLKRWLLAVNAEKVTKEQVESEFPAFAEDFKWQLVRGYLMEKMGLKIEQKDITDAAEGYVKYQYAMYGLPEVPAEILKDAVNNILSDRKQLEGIVERVEDQKVIDAIKGIVSLKSTKISAAKFRELK